MCHYLQNQNWTALSSVLQQKQSVTAGPRTVLIEYCALQQLALLVANEATHAAEGHPFHPLNMVCNGLYFWPNLLYNWLTK